MSDADTKHVLGEGRHLRLVKRGTWEFVERRKITGIVGLIAMTEDLKLVLIDQYREPVRARVIELPAGLAGDEPGSDGEPLMEAARRELLEETGFYAHEMARLLRGPLSPGLTDEVIDIFWATRLERRHAGGGVEGESIKVHEVPVGEVGEWLEERASEGFLVDPKIYAGLHFIHRKLAGTGSLPGLSG